MAKKVKRFRGQIKKERKHEVLVRDVLNQIRTGNLKPGDRIMSVVDFCTKYTVSQRVVDAAVDRLREMDIIESRHRIGNFIKEYAPEKVKSMKPPKAPVHEELSLQTEPRMMDLRDFYVPKNMRTSLVVYVCDFYPEMMSIWNRVLSEYSAKTGIQDIRVLSCLDGHIQDVLTNTHIDVIETTPMLINALGKDSFYNFSDLSKLDINKKDLLPIIQERIDKGSELVGAPFALTLSYIYVNDDLIKDNKLKPFSAKESYSSFMTRCREINDSLEGASFTAMVVSEFIDFLMMSGAVTIDNDGKCQVNAKNAEACFAALYQSKFRSVGCMDGMPLFTQKKILTFRHCSYEVPTLKRQTTFKWSAMPLPMQAGAKFKSSLTVLGINKNTPFYNESVSLVNYLCSAKTQKRFGAGHSNMPVLKDVAFDDGVLEGHPISKKVIKAQLEQSSLLWSDDMEIKLNRVSYRLPIYNLIAGTVTPAEVLKQFKEEMKEIS